MAIDNTTCPKPTYSITHDDYLAFYAALTFTLIVARLFGELARFVKQPSVLGELIAGILLGKTVLGNIWPAAFAYLYGPSRSSLAFSAVMSFSVTMYMLVAGLEMNLSQVMRKKRATSSVSFFAIVLPLLAGFVGAVASPELFSKPPESDVYIYALFVGTALCITALPVAAKTLRDLSLYRTDMGSIVMGSATVNDLFGWCLFAIVLALSQTSYGTNNPGIVAGVVLSVVYVIFMLTLGRFFINKTLPFAYAYLTFPGGVYGYVGVLTLASASFAIYIGLHNTLGAFLVGAAVGNSAHAKPSLQSDIDVFVTYVLAPLFFGSVCIQANFATDFRIEVVALVTFIGFLGKLVGGYVGARLGRVSIRESTAIALCMNARGAMELILAQVALSSKVINEPMFVALVILAIVSSLIPGPVLRCLMFSKESVPVKDYIAKNGFVPDLKGTTSAEVIRELCEAAGTPLAFQPVMEQEEREPTGFPDQLALPHALVANIPHPIIVVGVSKEGVNFRSKDNALARIIVLLLCPQTESSLESGLITKLTSLFSRPLCFAEVLKAKTRVDFLAVIAVQVYAAGHEHTMEQVPPPIPQESQNSEAREDFELDLEERIEPSASSPRALPDETLHLALDEEEDEKPSKLMRKRTSSSKPPAQELDVV